MGYKLGQEWHPVPKVQHIKKKKKSRTIPSKRVRGKVTKGEYEKAVEHHGLFCYFCGSGNNLEMHHVCFRSNNGRGTWRNLRLLCAEHHRGIKSVHTDKRMRKELEELHEQLYGEWYWADRYDLYKAGLIPEPTKKEFEKYMGEQNEKNN